MGEVSEEIAGQELYKERDENVYEVPGDMKLTDFNDLTNFGVEDPRMTTIGGVVFRYLDRLPEVGDQVVMDGLIATVLDMEGHRLARVRVAKSSLGEEEPEAGTPEENEESPGETTATQADGAKDGTEAYGPTSMGQAGQEERLAAGESDLTARAGRGQKSIAAVKDGQPLRQPGGRLRCRVLVAVGAAQVAALAEVPLQQQPKKTTNTYL